ncbi:SCO7613 C-terminal domain-containing membrane protein [Microbacterium sp. NPDC091313]
MSTTDATEARVPAGAWPSDPGMLRDTGRCPACFATLTAMRCAVCGFDVADARMHHVLEVSLRLADTAHERAELIRSIRVDQRAAERARASERAGRDAAAGGVAEAAGAQAPAREPEVVVPPRPPVPAAPVSARAAAVPAPPAPVPPAPAARAAASAAPPAPQPAPAEPSGPRRSGVQVLLLTIGVVLLAVAAVFFLTVAWVSGGLVLRSAIIGLVTAAIVATATLLRRRGLTATAEGIAALGIAFVALDVWAVRANDLAGAAALDARLYWGVAALAAGAGMVGWSRLATLRAPLPIGLAALAVGPGLLVAALADAPGAGGAYAVALPIAAVTLAAPATGVLTRALGVDGRLERGVLRALAAAAVLVAVIAALLLAPDAAWAPVLAGAPLAVIAAGHAAQLARSGATAPAALASLVAVLIPVAAVTAVAVRLTDPTFGAAVPLLVAALIALALDRVRVLQRGAARTALGAGALAAGCLAALAALWPVAIALAAFAGPAAAALRPWRLPAGTVVGGDGLLAGATAAVAALAGVVVLAALAWTRSAGGARRAAAGSAALAVLLLAGPQLRVQLAIALWYVLIAAAAAIALRRARRGPIEWLPMPALWTTLGAALALGYGLAFGSAPSWLIAVPLIVIVALVAAAPHPPVLAIVAPAAAVFVVLDAALVPALLAAAYGVAVAGLSAATAATVAAAAVFALATVPWPGSLPPARETVAVTIAPLAALGVCLGASAAAPTAWWTVSAAMAATAAAVAVAVRARGWRTGRPVAAALAAPFAAAAAVLAVRLADAPLPALVVAPGAVAVLAIGAAALASRRDSLVRAMLDAGAALAALAGVLLSVGAGDTWLALLLLAAAAVPAAVGAGGVIAAASPRRHLVWVAVAAGSLALWLALADRSVVAVEPYTVPPALALLAIAALTERARRRIPQRTVAAPAAVAGAGTALLLLPTGLAGIDDAVRATIAVAASVVVLVVAAWVRLPRAPLALTGAVAAAAALGAVVATTVRVLAASGRPTAVGLDDALVLATALAVVAAGVGLPRRAEDVRSAVLSRGAVVAGVAVLATGAAVLVGGADGPVGRVLAAIVLLGVIAVGAVRDERWGGATAGWSALGGALLVAAVAVAAGVRPVEASAVPLGAAILLTALADRAAGSAGRRPVLWAAGLAAGVLPSAIAGLADAGPLRAGVVLGVSLALALAAAAGAPPRVRPLVGPTLAVSIAAAIVAAAPRALASRPPVFEVWLLALVVPLIGAALLLTRWRPRTAAAVVIAGLASATALTALRLPVDTAPAVRAALTVAAVAAVALSWPGEMRRLVFWAGAGLSAALIAVAVASGASPIDAVTAPLAAALVIDGVRRLRADAAVGSWPALGAGLALLLGPSLLYDVGARATGAGELARVIALGVVALAVLLAGVRWRLQSAVLLGGGVLLLHAVAQLWPWITALYESVSGLWWLWLGIAGVLLIVVAATYERRIRQLRAVALAIRGLR